MRTAALDKEIVLADDASKQFDRQFAVRHSLSSMSASPA
jgi:hypothetical protein